MRGNGLLLSMLLLVPALTARASDKPLLIELEQRSGALPGGVSASGAVVVGGLATGGGFYWMPTTGVIFIGGLGATNVSRDGSTIVGVAADSRGIQAAIWQRAAEWRLLGSFRPGAASCDASLSSATDTSRDGKVVVGLGVGRLHHRACLPVGRVGRNGGPRELRRRTRQSRATACRQTARSWSATRRHATGFTQGAQWVDGRQELFTGPGGLVGTAKAANSDGSIVVGRVCNPAAVQPSDPTFQSGWVWTRQDGLRCLPAPQLRVSPGPLIIVEAKATSDDGRVIGGGQNVGGSDDSERRHLDRPRPVLSEGLPAGERRAGRVRDLGQHGIDHRHLAGWPRPRRQGRRGAGLPGLRRDPRRPAMKRLAACALAIVLLALSAPARAQSWELSGVAGAHPVGRPRPSGAGAERTRHPEAGSRGAFRRRGRSVRTGAPRSPGRGNRRRSELETGAGSADLFTMTVGQLHGNAVRQFGAADARLRPFVFAGVGATFLSGGRSRIRDEAVVRARRRRQVLSLESDRRPRTRSIQADAAERRRCRALLRPVRLLPGRRCTRSSSPSGPSSASDRSRRTRRAARQCGSFDRSRP